MTIQEFIETAKIVDRLAEKYCGDYIDWYDVKRLDCGNIVLEVPRDKQDDFFKMLPDTARNVRTYMQFCFYDGSLSLCMYNEIRDIAAYKAYRKARQYVE